MEKSIIKNAIFNTINKGIQILFPLITTSYISRVLGPIGVGEISSVQNLTTYFTIFAALGIPSYGVRVISQTKKNQKLCNKAFTELFIINTISTLVCILLYFYILNMTYNIYNCTLALIFSSLIFFNFANIEWLYQGFEEYRYITIRSIFIKLLSLIFLFLLVKDEEDIVWYAVIICFGIGGNYILNLINLKKYVQLSFKDLSLNEHFSPIIIFFMSVIAIEIYSLLDITMLTVFVSKESVGYYTNATKIVKMVSGVLTSFAAVLLPRFSYYFSERNYKKIGELSRKFLNITILVGLPSSLGIFLLADQIVTILFGSLFSPVVLIIKILTPLIIFMPLSGGVFCQILLTSGREKLYFYSVGIGAVINAILNIILISKFMHNGAAIASVISEILVSLMMIIFSYKIVKIQFSIKEFSKIIISGLIMALVIFYISKIRYIKFPILLLILEVISGIIIYFFLLWRLKSKIMYEIVDKLLKKN
ncbi:flippase [Fusobacterium sp.]|uniref:flippase n=1 Tax=Fusobacterium sp. TaxID=68766 RepID=UPI001D676F6B|nr:flippase [Fusobacterium sp.]MBS5789932.1 flippase [Fusobacterium sp.]